jgi:tripartite-type tricarboxylate transporter receptor subunit TctC
MKQRLILSLLSLVVLSAQATTWPNGPIKLVVPYKPGAITDDLARSVGEPLSAELKVPIVYEYKPGVSGIAGSNYVAKSKPDGQTLLIMSNTIVTASLTTKIPFDPLLDFKPIAILTKSPMAIIIRSNLNINSIDDLIRYSELNPGKLSFATSGVGSLAHLAIEKTQQVGGFKMNHIPYKGVVDIWQDFFGGRLDVVIDTPAGAAKYVGHKDVKVLAFTSDQRLDFIPTVPTVKESVLLKDFTSHGSFLIFAPANTPDNIVKLLSEKLSAIVNSTAFKSKFKDRGMISVGSTPSEALNLLKNDYETWKTVSSKIR